MQDRRKHGSGGRGLRFIGLLILASWYALLPSCSRQQLGLPRVHLQAVSPNGEFVATHATDVLHV